MFREDCFGLTFFMICRIYKRVSDNTDSPSCVCKALDTESIYVYMTLLQLLRKKKMYQCVKGLAFWLAL